MKLLSWTALALLLTFSSASISSGQAYCALRDPVRTLYKLFPEADSHVSIVREVSHDARQKVSDRLPFTLHSTELGTHTIYVVQRAGKAEGLVHVRSEHSDWGLVEVAWAIDPDLRIRGYEIQRCRSRHREEVESGKLADTLIGSSSAELQALIDANGAIDLGGLGVPTKAQPLARALIRSGLKTLEVTPVVWGADIAAHGIGTGVPPAPAAAAAD